MNVALLGGSGRHRSQAQAQQVDSGSVGVSAQQHILLRLALTLIVDVSLAHARLTEVQSYVSSSHARLSYHALAPAVLIFAVSE